MIGGEQEGDNKTTVSPTQDSPAQSDDETGLEAVLEIVLYVDGVAERSSEMQIRRLFGTNGEGPGNTETGLEVVVGVDGTTLSPTESAEGDGDCEVGRCCWEGPPSSWSRWA